MSGNADAYVTFLVVGALLVIADGQVILRSGREYLTDVYGDPGAARPASRLVAVLFHLAMFGLLALFASVNIPVDGDTQKVVTKLGILLLILAIAHGCVIAVLSNLRTRARAQRLQEEVAAEFAGPHAQHPTVAPVLDEPDEVTPGGQV